MYLEELVLPEKVLDEFQMMRVSIEGGNFDEFVKLLSGAGQNNVEFLDKLVVGTLYFPWISYGSLGSDIPGELLFVGFKTTVLRN